MSAKDPLSFYEAPEVSEPARAARSGDETGLLRRWELLRIAYNGTLAAEVMLISALHMLSPGGLRSDFADPHFLRMLLGGALGANLCFCAGPVANAYLHWLGLRHAAVTAILFLMGTALAVLLTAVALLFRGAQLD